MITRNGANFIRSAIDPVNSAGVITANISWNIENARMGIVSTAPEFSARLAAVLESPA